MEFLLAAALIGHPSGNCKEQRTNLPGVVDLWDGHFHSSTTPLAYCRPQEPLPLPTLRRADTARSRHTISGAQEPEVFLPMFDIAAGIVEPATVERDRK